MSVVQINTGGACHLDANMISEVLPDLPLKELDMLVVENVESGLPCRVQGGRDIKAMVLSD